MGITIHYKGKAKSRSAIDECINTLSKTAQNCNWKYELIERVVKGTLYPAWGLGYEFIPSEELITKHQLEYFPLMVTKQNSGYYKIYKTRFANLVREFLRNGSYPSFSIDTVQKGILLYVHPKCDPLLISFDTTTLELIELLFHKTKPDVFYSFASSSCETQFAGFETHRIICGILKWVEQFLEWSDIYDECGFYETQDEKSARTLFYHMRGVIQEIGSVIKEITRDLGLTVTIGDET